ncbi:MAG TPA: PA14 domain-containing protein [Planctomycetota bacterium]|nr:PA14 domain-containing protein [Planctomycetota bacterium]
MPRIALFTAALAVAACDASSSGAGPAAATVADSARATADLAVARGRCLACHPATATVATDLAPLPSPPLAGIGARRAAGWLEQFLGGHHARAADASALTAFLRAGTGAAPLQPVAVAGEVARGEKLWRASACAACHVVTGIAGIEARTDHANTVAFLRDPAATRPDLGAHDFALGAGEASALAAFLLQSQRVPPASAPAATGLLCECFELRIENEHEPDLRAVAPKDRSVVQQIDVEPRTREHHFALRFTGELQVPGDGDYEFVCGSDDCSWLWLDGELVVRNEAIAPHRRRDGKVHLTAGWHALVVLYTQAAGGHSLEVLWRPPGGELQELPAAALRARVETLQPPADPGPLDMAAAARGRELFGARRCGACHAGIDAPAARPAKAWAELRGDACPEVTEPSAVTAAMAARAAAAQPRSLAARLEFALARDGCRNCHVRDGKGGLAAEVRIGLVEVEDLGDEGRLPPDLSQVGHRLRQPWIARVLGDGVRVRPYVRARMPKVSAARAAEYAKAFALLDTVTGDEQEPAFSTAAVTLGQRIVGSSGNACVTCHRCSGKPATGAQGMDLAVQHERLKPGWFRDWLLQPARLRPGTRMPTYWLNADAAIANADAVRVWGSLGTAAPLPDGLGSSGALVLEPKDRPRLHGAFLRDLSARCMVVGCPERTHYAYDLAHLRLAWLWRGEFVDADGTWNGRAGQLLAPLGQDWVRLQDLAFASATATPADAAAEGRRLLGWRLDAGGYPIFRLAVGEAEVEDQPRPRLCAGGSEMVRRFTCVRGEVTVGLEPQDGSARLFVDGAPAQRRVLVAGESMEVVYRW